MELYQITLIIAGLIGLAATVYCWRKNKDLGKIKQMFNPIISGIYLAIKGISGIFPSNTTLNNISTILEAAIKATTIAEQMWLDGNIDKEQRNIYAKNYISEILEQAGIPITESVEHMIDGAIALTCALLPHEVNESEH